MLWNVMKNLNYVWFAIYKEADIYIYFRKTATDKYVSTEAFDYIMISEMKSAIKNGETFQRLLKEIFSLTQEVHLNGLDPFL